MNENPLDEIIPNQRKPTIETQKTGFNISKISDADKERLAPLGFTFEPMIDAAWRPWVRIKYPKEYNWSGWEKNKAQLPIQWIIELTWDTQSLNIIGPALLWTNQQFIQIFTKDDSWKEWVASIILPLSAQTQSLNRPNELDPRLANILRPDAQDWQIIMNNIDYILNNYPKLNQQQKELFWRALKYGIENNGSWLEVVGLDKDIPNKLYVKFWKNHYFYKLFEYELQQPLLEKDGPRYNELLKRMWELTLLRPIEVNVTSWNWKQLNVWNPEWSKPLPAK